MRTTLAPWIERGRLAGEGLNGHFRLPGPRGTTLTVVASDSATWHECGLPGEPWEHVSVSTRTRTPTWDEMEFVRDAFFEATETVVQFSVPRENHINIHEHCLHLWRPCETVIPLPPKECV